MDNEELWAAAGKEIFWYQAPSTTLDDSNPPFVRWYPDGLTNACFNALDIHVRDGRVSSGEAELQVAAVAV